MKLRNGLLVATGAVLLVSGGLTSGVWAASAPPLGAAGPPMGETPRLANGRPNLTGLWRRRGDPSGNAVNGRAFTVGAVTATEGGGNSSKELVREGNQDYVEIDAEFIVKSSQDMPQYKPEYWDQVRKFEEFGYRRPADPQYGCKNPGVVRLSSPAEMFEGPNKITMIYGGPIDDPTSGHIWVREVPTNGRALPKPDDYEGLRPTGTSVGHWEGDTLVIETVDFPTDGVWYNIRGWVGSADAKVTERIRRQGNTLYYDQTVDDPAFLKPWVRPTQVSTIDTGPQAILPQPLTCDERDGSLLPGSAK